ncbi:MAG: circadian clock protein KaiA [Cyanobacteriota bacterium]|jgi:circadian clock protein KaiA
MSEPEPDDLPAATPVPALTIASLIRDPRLQEACAQWLQGGRHELVTLTGAGPDDLVQDLERRSDQVDAVLLQQGAIPSGAYQALMERGLMLPAVVIGEVIGRIEYHQAEVHLPTDQLEQLSYSLDAAISRLLRTARVAGVSSSQGATPESWKLPNRLRGRLGYLGVFYKRDPSRFLRNLPSAERRDLLASLTRTYRDLLLSYFRDPAAANQALESFVNTAFFSDLPITQTVEIHMNLIDEFWKQLKLEGHKNDFLQDYRLALLDVMAHLCEMYRRSIPPDAPLGLDSVPVGERVGDAHPHEVH